MLLADSEQVLRRLHHLKDLGVQIAIDDFGTGLLVAQLPAAGPVRHPEDRPRPSCPPCGTRRRPPRWSARSSTSARTLGRTTIAEGIEEQIELEGLVELGCELGQGHHLGRPVDAEHARAGPRALPGVGLSLPSLPAAAAKAAGGERVELGARQVDAQDRDQLPDVAVLEHHQVRRPGCRSRRTARSVRRARR